MPNNPSSSLEASGSAADSRTGEASGVETGCSSSQSWIEIELVDESGAGIADMAYVITLPDGSERKGKTDTEGRAREEGFTKGDCQVSFSSLDQGAWKAV